jgi:glycosyltransferase involved in cell wall biosynthesis
MTYVATPATGARKPFSALDGLQVVITHDFMESYGGAERVTQEMAKAFPDAPVVAILGRESVARSMGVEGRFRTILPARPALLRHYRYLAPAYPLLTSYADVGAADVVLSSSYAFAHRFHVEGAAHICYSHSPLRFAWTMTDAYCYRWSRGPVSSLLFRSLAGALRASDRRGARPIDEFLTQSSYVADQIRRFYGRTARVIGAPVDCDVFRPAERPTAGEHFLLCSRLVEPYKQPGIVVEAFRHLPHRLVVAGDGPAMSSLRAQAPPNVTFVGQLDDVDLVPLMQGCIAAIVPSRDDFGLVPVEVMACGRPVLAYAGGGALETIVPGVTGELFDAQTTEAILQAVRSFDASRYSGAACRAHALQWDSQIFRARLRATVEGVVTARRPGALPTMPTHNGNGGLRV